MCWPGLDTVSKPAFRLGSMELGFVFLLISSLYSSARWFGYSQHASAVWKLCKSSKLLLQVALFVAHGINNLNKLCLAPAHPI